jgi:hypothetical protein
MTTKKPTAKSGRRKLVIQKQTLRDLDSKTAGKNVRGGQKPPVGGGSKAMIGKC